jgi:mono/diheme cytochrome c family protein
MPQFQFRPEAVDSLIAYLHSIEVKDAGQTLVEQRCAKCHSTGKTGTSPYPGAQSFRNLGQRWRRDQLRQALLVGIIVEHDKADVRVPPMKLTPAEADSFLDYLQTIATREYPAPR